MPRVNVAGVKSRNEKKPSLVVVTARTKPFPSPVSVTFTFGTTAPAASWTTPDSTQEVFWAKSETGSKAAISRGRIQTPLLHTACFPQIQRRRQGDEGRFFQFGRWR